MTKKTNYEHYNNKGDNMRKYYLFIYKNNSKLLYTILETLYSLKMDNVNYGVELFNQVCDTFSVRLLNNYIKEKYAYKLINKKLIKLLSNDETTTISIRYATTIIITNKNMPAIFKIFNIYNKKIFVVDFYNKDYFWLNEQIKNKYS